MLPRNSNLAIGKKEGYNNKILVSNTAMKIGSNKDIKGIIKSFLWSNQMWLDMTQ